MERYHPNNTPNFDELSNFDVLKNKLSQQGYASNVEHHAEFSGMFLVDAMMKYNPALYNAALQDFMVVPNTINNYNDEVKRACIGFLTFAQQAHDFTELHSMLASKNKGIDLNFIDGTSILIVGEINVLATIGLSLYYKNIDIQYIVVDDDYVKDNYGNKKPGLYWMYGLDFRGFEPTLIRISVGSDFNFWHLDTTTYPVDVNAVNYRKSACEELISQMKAKNFNRVNIILYDDLFLLGIQSNGQRSVFIDDGAQTRTCTSTLNIEREWRHRWESGEDERFNMKMEYSFQDLLFKSIETCYNPFNNNFNFSYSVLKPENNLAMTLIADAIEELHTQVMYTLSEKMDELGNQPTYYTNAYSETVKYCDSVPYKHFKRYLSKART